MEALEAYTSGKLRDGVRMADRVNAMAGIDKVLVKASGQASGNLAWAGTGHAYLSRTGCVQCFFPSISLRPSVSSSYQENLRSLIVR
jgi:hypothetical protein